jgi:hypothetical protein
MQAKFGQSQINLSKSANASLLTRWITVALATGALSTALVLAQSGKLGSYTGTLQVSGTEVNPQTTFRATVKVSLPVTERDSSSFTADFITDGARLTGKYTLRPTAESTGKYGPIAQEWDLRLSR